ncbi:glycoside hydrolase [Staphylotrichum tortipilum]|uniref:lytic cellulose monooxygenase (C4-dehydrogenating) n=1 Tax=Staphylotrichum tortipilum TaxID=2831512 RepID=A0AAN6MGS2_9PEZI|nr:glycoside hydrolase [Staphylotrichum longicolle]
MKVSQATSVLALAAQALSHSSIHRVTADKTTRYPGGGSTGPVLNLSSPAIAWSILYAPAPGLVAQARAGSNVTFHWSRWLYSHKGPITAWIAPYEGDMAKVDMKLEFRMFSQEAKGADGNGFWTARLPADIKLGTYIIRQELTCFALNITGFGTSSPRGTKFPGAYSSTDAGLF